MLKEKLQTDTKEAIKSRDATKRMVLSLLQSAIKNKELEKRSELSKSGVDISKLDELSILSDEEIMDVISSEVKKRKESIESYEKGGREELAKKERDELTILMEYMPEQMSEVEIRKIVQETIKDMALSVGALTKVGQVIGAVMVKVKGKADGSLVSKLVREELST